MNEIKTWPNTSSGDTLFFGFSMSSQGNRFGHETSVFDSQVWTTTQQVRDLSDNVSLSLSEYLTTENGDIEDGSLLRLSADGTLVAVARGDSTSVYENGVLINTFRGKALAWFDDNRLLIELDYDWRIVDSSGHLQPTPKLSTGARGAQIVSATKSTREILAPHKVVFDSY